MRWNVNVVIHDLDEITITENAFEPTGYLASLFLDFRGVDSFHHGATEFAADTTRQTDDAFVIRLQDLFIDSRLEVETFQ